MQSALDGPAQIELLDQMNTVVTSNINCSEIPWFCNADLWLKPSKDTEFNKHVQSMIKKRQQHPTSNWNVNCIRISFGWLY